MPLDLDIQTLRRKLTPYFLSYELSLDKGRGTAFPSSPAVNWRFFRTDLGFACYYDGAQWLSAHEYALQSVPYTPTVPSAAFYTVGEPANLGYAAPRTDYSLYMTRWVLAYISDTNQ